MPNPNHTHTFVKYKRRPGYWRCAAPDCTYMCDEEVVLGKYSCCNICGDEFILQKEDLRRVKPRCLKCSNTKKGEKFRAGATIASRLFGSSENEGEEIEYQANEVHKRSGN